VGSVLVLYARVPRLGRVKTRMTPWLSDGEALRLHLALLLDSLWLLRRAAADAGAIPILSFSERWTPEPMGDHDDLAAASRGLMHRPQRDGDLGRRLEDTFAGLHAEGHEEVVVIGSDCPALSPDVVHAAFEALRQGARVVLGPAVDGGYYLVGAGPPVPGIFSGIPWSTGRVMEATLAALDRASVRASILPLLDDVDVPSDLERLAAGAAPPRTGPGEKTLAFVAALRLDGRLPPAPPGDYPT
jgi:rSAM/selenodomain-associated transferase 1